MSMFLLRNKENIYVTQLQIRCIFQPKIIDMLHILHENVVGTH